MIALGNNSYDSHLISSFWFTTLPLLRLSSERQMIGQRLVEKISMIVDILFLLWRLPTCTLSLIRYEKCHFLHMVYLIGLLHFMLCKPLKYVMFTSFLL